jgi:hypothetical protein
MRNFHGNRISFLDPAHRDAGPVKGSQLHGMRPSMAVANGKKGSDRTIAYLDTLRKIRNESIAEAGLPASEKSRFFEAIINTSALANSHGNT